MVRPFSLEEGVEFRTPEAVFTGRCPLRRHLLLLDPPTHRRYGDVQMPARLGSVYPRFGLVGLICGVV